MTFVEKFYIFDLTKDCNIVGTAQGNKRGDGFENWQRTGPRKSIASEGKRVEGGCCTEAAHFASQFARVQVRNE